MKYKKTMQNSLIMFQNEMINDGIMDAKSNWYARRGERDLFYFNLSFYRVRGLRLLFKILYWMLDVLVFIKDVCWAFLYAFFYVVFVQMMATIVAVAYYIGLIYLIFYLLFG